MDKEVAELSDRKRYAQEWNSAANETDPQKWAAESHELCKSVVYSDQILKVVRETPPGARLAPISLPSSYMRKAGEVATRRIITAGIRLAANLDASRANIAANEETPDESSRRRHAAVVLFIVI